jgi:hypothetical protein
VMRIAMTHAKTGRSMKKWDMVKPGECGY